MNESKLNYIKYKQASAAGFARLQLGLRLS